MGKMPFFLNGEVATWEIFIWENVYLGSCDGEIAHLGSCHLGNCHFGSCTWENPLGKFLTPKTSL